MHNQVVQVAVGTDGTTWCRDSLGKMYKVEGNVWKQNPSGIAEQIAVADADNIWCSNKAGNLFKLKDSAHDAEWEKDADAKDVVSLSVTPTGAVYVTNKKGELWKKDGGPWTRMPGPSVPSTTRTHTVKEGEHLFKILRNTYPGISESELPGRADEVARLNGWTTREKTLYPGDVIILEA